MYSLINQIRLFTAFMIIVWIMMMGITIDNNSKVAAFTKERQRISDANRGVWLVTTNIAEQAALLESYIQTGDIEIYKHFQQLFNDYKNGLLLAKNSLPPDDAVTLDGINSAFEQWMDDYATPMSNATKEWKSNILQLADVNDLRVKLHSKSIIEPILSRTDKLFVELDGDASHLDSELNSAEKWLSISVWSAGFIGISLTILSVLSLIRLLKSRLSILSQSTKKINK